MQAETQMQEEEIADLQSTITEQELLLTELKSRAEALEHERDDYQDAVSTATYMLGHSGNSPADLIDALGQIERLLDGHDRDATELIGIAGKLRALYNIGDGAALLINGGPWGDFSQLPDPSAATAEQVAEVLSLDPVHGWRSKGVHDGAVVDIQSPAKQILGTIVIVEDNAPLLGLAED